ncbi:sugar ABC transporter substrate-binding protein [Neobacillus pocheonensis]|uniref:ABC transporter substrate-binding protein n=1 Tax=Neobacillus pocheonensis TaxID=363869 RepID=UPI003D270CE5
MKTRKYWKKIGITLAALSMTLLTACSSGSSIKESSAEGTQSDAVKLRIVWWGAQNRHDATKKVLDLYTKKHPNVTFVSEFSGWDGYWDKLATQAAGKNAPDIIQMDAQYLQEYAGRNQLADLSSGIKVSDMDKNLLDTGKYKDKLYAVPLGNNATGIIYNKQALEKLGLPLPKSDWTWDELFKMAREIQPKLPKGKYALKDLTYDRGVYEEYQFGQGKGSLSTPEGKANIDKETWLSWCKIFSDLRKEGVVPPPEVSVSEKLFDPKQDLLLSGTVLMKRAFAAEYPAFDSVSPGAYELAKSPRGKQASGYLKPSMFWSVSSQSKNVEEAKKFIDFFINDKEAGEILGTTRGIPVSKQVLDNLTPKFSQQDTKQVDLIKETAPDANPFNGGPQGFGNFTKEFERVGQEYIFGRIKANQAYQELLNKWKETIKN